MANRLKMNMVQAVVALFEQNWSQRRIAGELGIDRGTVSRYLKRWQNSKPAIVHTGSEAKPADVHTGFCRQAIHLLAGLPVPGLLEPSGPATDSARSAQRVCPVPRPDPGQARSGTLGPAHLAGSHGRARFQAQLLQCASLCAKTGAGSRVAVSPAGVCSWS